jgi:hypothetical protein
VVNYPIDIVLSLLLNTGSREGSRDFKLPLQAPTVEIKYDFRSEPKTPAEADEIMSGSEVEIETRDFQDVKRPGEK